MPIGWFICPYKERLPRQFIPVRYCAMDDFTQQILTDGGRWSETEILGDRAIVKVRASLATLDMIAAAPTFRRIPRDALDDSLSALTQEQRNAIKNEILDAGYTPIEVNTQFPDLAIVRFGDVLRFMATRRLKPRRAADGSIAIDGGVQACKSINDIDKEI